MEAVFARRMSTMKRSEIREILKITQQEDIISFAGGLPAPELFPLAELRETAGRILDQAGQKVLQYSMTEGYRPLRETIALRMNRKFQTAVTADHILITNGSQQALDFTGKLFLDEEDIVLCESPTYLAAITAFRSYQPRFIEVPTDDEGMIIDELERILANTARVKLIYVIPDFQNPTGRTWSLARRRQFIQVVQKYKIPVVEDNPYGELRFEKTILPALHALDKEGLVIFASTFSKTFCPGMRIGWIAAPLPWVDQFVLIKQAADLCTSEKAQHEVLGYMEEYDFEGHIDMLIQVYRRRRDVMVEALTEHMPSGVRFTRPEGGLFLWVTLPGSLKAMDILQECLQRKVAFVPGDCFFPNGGVENTLRLNYSNMPEEKIKEGVVRIAQVVKEFLQ